MKADKYVNAVSNLFVKNRLLKFVVIVLAALQLMNYISMKELQEQQMTIVIPVGNTEKLEIGSSTADEAYLNAMAVYIAQLLYSTTPVTVEMQTKALLTLFTPDAYKQLSDAYLLSAVNQAKNQVSLTSKILEVDIQYEPRQTITITLLLDRHIFSEIIESNKQIRLKIDYAIQHGKFVITGLGET